MTLKEALKQLSTSPFAPIWINEMVRRKT